MEEMSTLKTLLLAYTANMQLFELTQSSFDYNLALYRRRKKRKLMVLQHLRKRQIFLLGLLQQNATQRSLWKLDRESQFWEIIYDSSDDYFKSHLRMTRASFEILCSLLRNLKRADTACRRAIPLPKRIAIALFALGSSVEYRVVSELFGVGKSTVCTILLEFCKEVWPAMSTQYIKKLPPTNETLAEYVEGFSRLGFPQCLGAIGGCHIEIKPNPTEANDYCNIKGWYSIVLLALVDYRCTRKLQRFTNIRYIATKAVIDAE
ncbi:PREDICTED: uncharacterized protein LOC108371591 [Rhagoletis zephyria]|uniref:uncharacterized protein LOC108371591 n=1 Tax=Rhagoletis zephyria TaxID=28612 RepID=UPI0008119C01|nr:PREDICTED: uncharacterized protein LOC108371591 [Rhagoletis zephyria]